MVIGQWWGKPEGRLPVVKCGNKWECNIKTYFKEVIWEGLDWITLARNRCKCWALMT
jgi:hypothetical protein